LRRKRIGILGGTFNPPHFGHLVLAQETLKKLKLYKVIFIPTYTPPHKMVKGNNALMRYKMVALACKTNPKFEASKIELEKRAVSYSVDTLRRLKTKFGKGTELFFIIGSDSLSGLESWRNMDEILKLANFVVAYRPGYPIKKLNLKVKSIKVPTLDISSSAIRGRVRRSQSIKSLVPEPVRKFIIDSKLYKQ
jgi:nicotinate-nucleotide adenylyltransferase